MEGVLTLDPQLDRSSDLLWGGERPLSLPGRLWRRRLGRKLGDHVRTDEGGAVEEGEGGERDEGHCVHDKQQTGQLRSSGDGTDAAERRRAHKSLSTRQHRQNSQTSVSRIESTFWACL